MPQRQVFSAAEKEFQKQVSLVPSFTDLFNSLMVSVVLLATINLTDVYRGLDSFSYSLVADGLKNVVGIVLEKLDKFFSASLVTILFWAMVGLCTYVIAWVVKYFISSSTEDLPLLKHVVIPSGVNESSIITEKLIRLTVRMIGIIALVVWTIYFLAVAVPYSSVVLLFAFSDIGPQMAWPIFQSVVSMAACLIMYITIFRIVLLRRKFL